MNDILGLPRYQFAVDAKHAVHCEVLPVDKFTEHNLYVTINEASNTEGRAKKKDIVRVTNFVIDFDSKRDHADGGKICATDDEKAETWKQVESCRMYLAARGWPEPSVIDSGNGYYLCFRVDLRPDQDKLLRSVLQHLRPMFPCVDESTWNSNQLVRVVDSWNRKAYGPNRPQRQVRLVSRPSTIETVPTELLKSFTPTKPQPAELQTARLGALADYIEKHTGQRPVRQTDLDNVVRLDFDVCLANGLPHGDGRNLALFVLPDRIHCHCFHAKHANVEWFTLEEKWGESFSEYLQSQGKADLIIRAKTCDPMELAQEHLRQTEYDGQQTVQQLQGKLHAWTTNSGWVALPDTDAKAALGKTVQAMCTSSMTNRLLNDAWANLRSLAYEKSYHGQHAPFWLDPNDWDAKQCLALSNGILNVERWVNNQEHLIPLTPRLYYTVQSAFNYDPSATCPEWHKFLTSLKQTTEWYQLLAEMMGASLAPNPYQKFFMLHGPRRSGKGTITKVLTRLVGDGYRSAPQLKQFVKFGLQNSIGKRICLVPEARAPKELADIVETLKAITGGDALQIDQKFTENTCHTLDIQIWMLTNNYVVFPDTSGAMASRCIPLIFTESFLGDEDEELLDKLIPELPGILNWALEGRRRLFQQGFTLPESTKARIREFERDGSPILEFIHECCEVGEQHEVECPELLQRYIDFTGECTSPKAFALELRSSGTPVAHVRSSTTIRGKRPYVWRGLKLKGQQNDKVRNEFPERSP